MYYSTLKCAVGTVLLLSDGEAITGLYMRLPKRVSDLISRHDDMTAENLKPLKSVRMGVYAYHPELAPLAAAKEQLLDYFQAKRQTFDLKIAMHGTDFQKEVWRQLTKIPYGTTISYGELARRVGNINASRAVGAANGCNPVSIIVPCHRVIGANGSLTGFGGGLDNKTALLSLEAENAESSTRQLSLLAKS